MKFCLNCGKEIKEDAKFCPFCGSDQPDLPTGNIADNQPIANAAMQQPTASQQTTTNQATQQSATGKLEEFASSETVQEIKQRSMNYFTFLNKNVVSPQIGDDNVTNHFALVNYILIVLINGLAISRLSATVIGSFYDTNFVFLLEFILLVAAALFTYPLTHFILEKVVYKQNISLLDSFSRIFSPVSVVVYTSLATLLLVFIANSTVELLLFLFIVSFGLISYSFAASLWTAQDMTGKNGKFYLVVLSFILCAVLGYIIFRIFGGILVDKLELPSFSDFFDMGL